MIMNDKDLSEYQKRIRNELRKKFPLLNIEIGRGDRLIVNNQVIKGFMVYDHKRLPFETDIEVFSKEIQLQYLVKIRETDLTDYQIKFYKLDEELKYSENKMYKDKNQSSEKSFEETIRKEGEVKIFGDLLIELEKKCSLYEELIYNIESTMDRIYSSPEILNGRPEKSDEVQSSDFVSGMSSYLYDLNQLNCRLQQINYRLSLLA